MSPALLVLAGIALAAAGGELFVRGILGLARWWRVPPGVVAATLAAFATSAPELSVAVNAARAAAPEIALGNALGANVVNIALILGIAMLLAPLRPDAAALRIDAPAALAAPLAIGFAAWDGSISRADAALLGTLFFVWLGVRTAAAGRDRVLSQGEVSGRARWLAVAYCGGGLACLFAAGDLIVAGGRGLAAAYGLGEFLVGATIVAIGTTVPELATTLVARLRGEDSVGLATVLGSTLFNALAIVPVAGLIHPIAAGGAQLAWVLAAGLLAVALAVIRPGRLLGRGRGALLLGVYVAYLAVLAASAADA